MAGPGQEGPTLFDPDALTESYRRALTIADHEVRRAGHRMMEPEHLLIGLLAANGVAALALYEAGVSLAPVCRRVEKALGVSDTNWYLPRMVEPGEPQPPRPRFVGHSTESKDLLEASFEEANRLGHTHVTTAHLLSAIIRDGRNGATRVLKEAHVRLEQLRDEALERCGEEE